MSEDKQRSLMRSIWEKNKSSGRIKNSSTPWLEEQAIEYDHSQLDAYGNPKMTVTAIDFPQYKARRIPAWEQRQRFRQSIEYLYWQAVRARTLASSYRGFDVGCALLAFKPGQPHRESWEVHLGMNTKVSRNARPVCAEPIAISGAYASGCSWVIGMVIVGELREEDVGITKTLHPCEECRMFMDDKPVIRPDTIIVTAKPPVDGKPGEYEIRTFKRLTQFHALLHDHL